MKVIKLRGKIWLSAGKDGQCWGYTTFLFLDDQGNPVSNSLLQRPYILFNFEPTEIFSRFLLLASTLFVFRGVIWNAGVMHCLLIGISSCGCWGWVQRASEPARECVRQTDRQTNRQRKRETDRQTDRQIDKTNFYNKDSGTRSIWTASPLYTTNTVKHERTVC